MSSKPFLDVIIEIAHECNDRYYGLDISEIALQIASNRLSTRPVCVKEIAFHSAASKLRERVPVETSPFHQLSARHRF